MAGGHQHLTYRYETLIDKYKEGLQAAIHIAALTATTAMACAARPPASSVQERFDISSSVALCRQSPALLERPTWSDAEGHPLVFNPQPSDDPSTWDLVFDHSTDTEGWTYGSVFRWGLGKPLRPAAVVQAAAKLRPFHADRCGGAIPAAPGYQAWAEDGVLF